ncbi:MAG: ABC transporter permease subunit [Gammaproteobacteria bacterium]|nr:ABC transporter permease subunit [Gammaproteobacteria bacterium]
MKSLFKGDDFLVYNPETGIYTKDPEQAVRDEVEKHHWKNNLFTILKDWRLYLMLLPMLFVFFCWRYLPMYELLASWKINLTGTNKVAEQDWVGYGNFYTLLFGTYKAEFWQAFRNTFILSFYGLLFGFPFPIILALFFNEIKSNKYRAVLQVFTYLPKFISTVIITTLIWLLLARKGVDSASTPGILARLLAALHIVPKEIAESGMMYQPGYFRAIYILTGIWEGAGYGSIVYFSAVIAINPTSYEAAQIDGAGKMAQMRYVVLPAMLSTIVIMLIVRIGSLLSIGYEQVLLMRHNDTLVTAQVISTFAIDLKDSANTNLATVPELVNNVTSMLLVIGANKISAKASDTSLY